MNQTWPANRRHSHALKLRLFSHLVLLICTSTTSSPVHATIYKAEDAINRVTIYSNVPIRLAPGKAEAPELMPPIPQATLKPAQSPTPAPIPKSAPASAPTPTPTPTPTATAKVAEVPHLIPKSKVGFKSSGSIASDYPRIAPAVQKARDSERLAILANELQLEQAGLAEALSRKAATGIIQRYTSNIEALKREIEYTK
ncbi:hypothetical protein [Noviherbaspirillum malthae]|uniref:hypothetical protein n=1 Tax=Noviherbaspirillum malthae TaxID=1260987 RepID=UPI001E2CD73A|nr:hypothetical protein [Noviherbaspirillum malthae]